MVAELMYGPGRSLQPTPFRGVIYTQPEIAWSARPSSSSRKGGAAYKAGSKIPFMANGRARGDGRGPVWSRCWRMQQLIASRAFTLSVRTLPS